MKIGLWDDGCKKGIKNVAVTGIGPQKISKVKTNADGEVLISNLQPGAYTLTADKYGFKKLIINDISIVAGMRFNGTYHSEYGWASDDNTPFKPNYDLCQHIDKPIE